MATDPQKQEEVRKIILALLLTLKDGCSINDLERDFYESEGMHIPWKSFGYVSLLDYLQNMPQCVRVEKHGNNWYVKGIASDKSKHVNSLVLRQKCQTKKRIGVPKTFRPSHYYPITVPPRFYIPAEILTYIIGLVNQYPDGLNKDYLLSIVQRKIPYSHVVMKDMVDQLQELSHEIYVDDNKIFPKKSLISNQSSKSLPVVKNKELSSIAEKHTSSFCAGGYEKQATYLELNDESDFIFRPAGYIHRHSPESKKNIAVQSTCSFIQETLTNHKIQTNCENTEDRFNNQDDTIKFMNDANVENIKDKCYDPESVNILINERLKFRLKKLIEKYPEGIWCAHLPEIYLEEYNISLNYTELGFHSIREFAVCLPEIFRCVQISPTEDFILYNAKTEIPLTNVKEKSNTSALASVHDVYMLEDPIEALPTVLSEDTCKKLIPDGVMTLGESVGYINVTDLYERDQYIEVFVVEVFTPSLFWIQLREKRKTFNSLMEHLNTFYTQKSRHYKIPTAVLEKGLNCACLYNDVWHRGIIKTVTPDLRVTVMFYDYGTLKTYPADAIHYLYRAFSNLPAQAIPCGLINTIPCNGNKWSQGVTLEFATRTAQIPLAAMIGSINEEDNSMLVTLTDTMEEEDVHINDWLIDQKLAKHGKMVCIKMRNFYFQYHLLHQKRFQQYSNTIHRCKVDKLSKSLKTVAPLKCTKENSQPSNVSIISKLDSIQNSITYSHGKTKLTRNGNIDEDCRQSIKENQTDSKIPDFPNRNDSLSSINSKPQSPMELVSLYEKLKNFRQSSKMNHKTFLNESNEFNTQTAAKSDRCVTSGHSSINTAINRKSLLSAKYSVKLDIQAMNMNINGSDTDDTTVMYFPIESQKNDQLKNSKVIDDTSEDCISQCHYSNENYAIMENLHHVEICDSTSNAKNKSRQTDPSSLHKKFPTNKSIEEKTILSIHKQMLLDDASKGVDETRRTFSKAKTCFLKMLDNSVYASMSDERIPWSSDGNIDQNRKATDAGIKRRRQFTMDNKCLKMIVPRKIFNTLTDNKLLRDEVVPVETSSTTYDACETQLNANKTEQYHERERLNIQKKDSRIIQEIKMVHTVIKDNSESITSCNNVIASDTVETDVCQGHLPIVNNDADASNIKESRKAVQMQGRICDMVFSREAFIANFKKLQAVTLDCAELNTSDLDSDDLSSVHDSDDASLSVLTNEKRHRNFESKLSSSDSASVYANDDDLNSNCTKRTSDTSNTNCREFVDVFNEIEEDLKLKDCENVQIQSTVDIQVASPLLDTETITVPIFNDVDIGSDDGEWDIHIELHHVLNNDPKSNLDNSSDTDFDGYPRIMEVAESVESIKSITNDKMVMNTSKKYEVEIAQKGNNSCASNSALNESNENLMDDITLPILIDENKNETVHVKDIEVELDCTPRLFADHSTNKAKTKGISEGLCNTAEENIKSCNRREHWKPPGKARVLLEMLEKVKRHNALDLQ
ncbi:hypothetical protein KM043_001681 [Ampulex compressa]|nr:hypothetical protein KM043_001681 [Ampulex compressa]